MQALIVEDDKHLARALAHILQKEGYGADVVYDGKSGLSYGESGIYDVIVFDVMLPKMDGLQAVAELRRKGVKTPVLMLTARDGEPDKIAGLDGGADTYMTKPFSPAELLARLRALTRRKVDAPESSCVQALDLALNLQTHELSCGGEQIHLSSKETKLADLLMTSQGRTITKQIISDAVWGDEEVESNNIEAYIYMLRKKLKFLNSRANIKMTRKVGYQLLDGEAGAVQDMGADAVAAETAEDAEAAAQTGAMAGGANA